MRSRNILKFKSGKHERTEFRAMRHRNIWISFLVIAMIGIILFLASRMKPTTIDNMNNCEIHLINNSGYDISLNVFQTNDSTAEILKSIYKIYNDSTFTQIAHLGNAVRFKLGEVIYSDSVQVFFGNERVITYARHDESKLNIGKISNYKIDNILGNDKEFSYTFTNIDLEHALPIENGEE